MDKKNKNILIFVICLVILIICFIVGYLIISSNNKNNKTSESNVVKKEKLNTIGEEELNKKIENEIYTNVELLSDMKPLETKFKISEERMFYIDGKNSFSQTTDGNADSAVYTIKIVKGIPQYENKSKNAKVSSNVNDVKRIYFVLGDPNNNIYFLTKKGEIYQANHPESGDIDKFVNPVKIKTSKKYKDLKLLVREVLSDQTIDYKLLGVIKDKYYLIDNNKEFDFAYQIDYIEDSKTIRSAYIKENREVYIDNKIIDKKYKQSFAYYYYNEAPYFVTEDNYLYSIKYNDLLTNSKIKGIYYKIEGKETSTKNYLVVFESMEIFEFTVNDEVK